MPAGARVALFPEGGLNSSCDHNSQPIASVPMSAATGEVVFSPQAAGRYQLQIMDEKDCHIGAPEDLIIAEPDNRVILLQQGVNNYDGAQDTSITRFGPLRFLPQGSASELQADGEDIIHGESAILLRWALPKALTEGSTTGNVASATITLDIQDDSAGVYGIYAMRSPWREDKATWDSANLAISQNTALLGEIHPTARGISSTALNPAGLAVVQSWLDGTSSNYGFVIRAIDARDGMTIRAREHALQDKRPRLILTLTE